MMRENQNDGAGGWWQPPGYGGQAGPRDENRDEGAGARWPGPDATPAPESDYPDTIGFGSPPGGGAPGWPLPDPPRRRSARGGRLLVYLAVAALAAGIGAGATIAFGQHHAAPAAEVSSGDVPGPHDNASGSGASSAPLDPKTVQKKVDPGLVDIASNLRYNGQTAEGTGMIISSSGLVLTNNHVIDGATGVRANLVISSDQTYTARVLGYDATHDVALLQLQGAPRLTPVSFGNSSQVRLGTPVLALGNAEGHGGTKPAAGIINALDRSIQASDEGSNSTEDLNHMLQTNARIEQGDSGGALANNAGQVIGMITAANTGTSSQSSSGGTLGFAIPINTALAIARQIAAGQASEVVHIGLPGFLGVQVATSDSSDPKQQAADGAQAGRNGQVPAGTGSCSTSNQPSGVPAQIAPIAAGALIVGVLCNSVAQVAGLVPGDVITAVDGQPVTTPGSLTAITGRTHAGDVVSVLWVNQKGVERTRRMRLDAGPAR
jgi:S1-C subfamily serine protease